MAKDRSLNNLIGNLHDVLENLLLNEDKREDDKEFTKTIQTAKAVSQVAGHIIGAESVLNERAKLIAEYMPDKSTSINDIFLQPKAIEHG